MLYIYNKYTYIRERGYILKVDNADFNVTLYFSRDIIESDVLG